MDIIASNNLNSIRFTFKHDNTIICNCVDITYLQDGDCIYFNSEDNTFCDTQIVALIISFENNVENVKKATISKHSANQSIPPLPIISQNYSNK